jgi:hypothetical protein
VVLKIQDLIFHQKDSCKFSLFRYKKVGIFGLFMAIDIIVANGKIKGII